MAYFKILSYCFGKKSKTTTNTSALLVSMPRFKPRTSWMWSTCANYYTMMLATLVICFVQLGNVALSTEGGTSIWNSQKSIQTLERSGK